MDGHHSETVRAVHDDDAALLDRFEPAVSEWWCDRFGDEPTDRLFTPPQREAIVHVARERSTLICAPTGSGKTLASHIAVIDALYQKAIADELADSVYCLYISPMRSLANDVHRNQTTPIEGISDRSEHDISIRHAIRHGDTDEATKRAMLKTPPHILNTTPETLAILLCAPAFREKLSTVEYVIVDEIHSLADGKRGTHLSVSLERLEALVDGQLTRIGCSATIDGLETMAEFLAGYESGVPRQCEIVDTRFDRDLDLELLCPVADPIGMDSDRVADRLYETLHRLIEDHTTTIVFTNSRSGAERTLFNLRERFEYTEETAACHHGSLAAETRQSVEDGLRAGSFDVVTTSTSLELGIDMPDVDLVVQLGSPKSVATLLQRVGRSGHRPGATVTGRVIALDRDTALECAAICYRANTGDVEAVSIPERAHDVATQHVYGMAIAAIRPEAACRSILRSAYPYRNYTDDAFESLFAYLTADYDGLEDRNVYPKIWRDENDPPDGEHHHAEFPPGTPLVGKRGRLARAIYMTNIGTITESVSCTVQTSDGEWIGELDGAYLDTLAAGDVFVLGGSRYVYRYRRGSKLTVEPTSQRPTVPRWYAQRRPMPAPVATGLAKFQGRLIDAYESGGGPAVRRWLREDSLFDENAVRLLARLIEQQHRFGGPESVPTPDRIVIEIELDHEGYRRHYHVHAPFGRRCNDGLARLLVHHCEQRGFDEITTAVSDRGITCTLALNQKIDLAGIVRSLDPATLRSELKHAIEDTELLKRQFRITATRGLMILKQYKGHRKSPGQQQVTSDTLLGFAHELSEFAILEETYRDCLQNLLGLSTLRTVLDRLTNGSLSIVTHRVESPTPLAFGLASLTEATLSDRSSIETFHENVCREIRD
ncbi:ATP-dependent helicase [Halocatena halophila]|uniref:ATP-dependent helicase n=1 Tax=Halocatena halophila TaxID=2814576 RepID=UPI002ED12321